MMVERDLITSDVNAYLRAHEEKELLRFVTVGSVDDGKSTLIGRLLYETEGVYEDQLASVKKATEFKGSSGTEIDFALITDGLKSEREQGITIDVAYRYFTTSKRKFIIADTPGHVQYTRNMATGASTANIAIILIDARLGVLEQSRRHAFIASLLGIKKLIVAVNKMDLVDYSEARFSEIQTELKNFLTGLHFKEVVFFPISALAGDNIVRKSEKTPWFAGGTILHYLETTPIQRDIHKENFYYPVQYVIRPNLNYRGFGGTIYSGKIAVGDKVVSLPSGKTSQVKSIDVWQESLKEAYAPLSVSLTLEDELDISRGDVIVQSKNDFHVSHHFEANIVWMDQEKLKMGTAYWIKLGSSMVTGVVKKIKHKLNMQTLLQEPSSSLQLNDIGEVEIALNQPLVLETYQKNQGSGAFIVIDKINNHTLAAGMVSLCGHNEQTDIRSLSEKLTSEERAKRFSQKPSVVWLTGRPGSAKIVIARSLERRLFESGHFPYVLDPDRIPHTHRHATGKGLDAVINYADIMLDSGAIVISAFTSPKPEDRQRVKEKFGAENVLEIYAHSDLETCKSRLEGLGRNPEDASVDYVKPSDSDYVLNAQTLNLNQELNHIMALLKKRGFII